MKRKIEVTITVGEASLNAKGDAVAVAYQVEQFESMIDDLIRIGEASKKSGGKAVGWIKP